MIGLATKPKRRKGLRKRTGLRGPSKVDRQRERIRKLELMDRLAIVETTVRIVAEQQECFREILLILSAEGGKQVQADVAFLMHESGMFTYQEEE